MTIIFFTIVIILSLIEALLLSSLFHGMVPVITVLDSWFGWLVVSFLFATTAFHTRRVSSMLIRDTIRQDKSIHVQSPSWLYHGLVNHLRNAEGAMWLTTFCSLSCVTIYFFHIIEFQILQSKIGTLIAIAILALPFLLWFFVWSGKYDPSDYVTASRIRGIRKEYGHLISVFYELSGPIFLVLSTLFLTIFFLFRR